MSGASNAQPPHITFNVSHKDFSQIETKLFFQENIGDIKNSSFLQSIDKNDIKMLTRSGERKYKEYKHYTFDIVLEGSIWYRKS